MMINSENEEIIEPINSNLQFAIFSDDDLKFEETRSLLPSTEFTAVDIEGLSDHQLLGAYYVVRGSANGSRFIVEKLEDRHPLFPYFNQMAALSLENWKKFKAVLRRSTKNKTFGTLSKRIGKKLRSPLTKRTQQVASKFFVGLSKQFHSSPPDRNCQRLESNN